MCSCRQTEAEVEAATADDLTARIGAYVRANPGCLLNAIRADLKVGAGRVREALATLEAEGWMRHEEVKVGRAKQKQYYHKDIF